MNISNQKDDLYWTDAIAAAASGAQVIQDEKTPSGRIHVGSLRGVVIHDAVFKSMKDKGLKTKFLYGFDDYDPMDALPVGIPKEFEKYMGLPLSEVPNPFGKGSYAEFFAKEFVRAFGKLGVKPTIYWGSKEYKKGTYDRAIKIALENAIEIRRIYADVSGADKENWLPFQPICDKCGKIGTTQTYDFSNDKVFYKCMPDLVKWARGCGHEGSKSPYKGGGKLPWKVEWAAKWFTLGVTYETAGKDHFTKGGSHDVAATIAREVYKINVPSGTPYEFFLIGGQKMSTSKGRGASALEMTEIVPPELLRFLLIKTRPNAQIDFDPSGYTIVRLYDEFLKYEEAFFNNSDNNMKRIYELSHIGELPKKRPVRVPLTHVATLVQFAPEKKVLAILKSTGHLEGATSADVKRAKELIAFAKSWVANYAPEELKFSLQEKIPSVSLTDNQKSALAKLAEFREKLSQKDFDSKMREVAPEFGLQPTELFEAAYTVLLNKSRGPRLVPFLYSLDKEFVVKRFRLLS